jgi:hypothetical protein
MGLSPLSFSGVTTYITGADRKAGYGDKWPL